MGVDGAATTVAAAVVAASFFVAVAVVGVVVADVAVVVATVVDVDDVLDVDIVGAASADDDGIKCRFAYVVHYFAQLRVNSAHEPMEQSKT